MVTKAALPAPGYVPPVNHFLVGTKRIVRVYPEASFKHSDFDFSLLNTGPDLQKALAEGFAAATGPGGTRKTAASAQSLYELLRQFTNLIQEMPNPPHSVQTLSPAHLQRIVMLHSRKSMSILQAVRVTLRRNADIPADFRKVLFAPIATSLPESALASYSEKEFRTIVRIARTKVRETLKRIRFGEEQLRRWRDSGHERGLSPEQHYGASKGWMLDYIDQHGDVPRDARDHPRGRVLSENPGFIYTLLPRAREVTAAAIFLQCVTGQNFGTIRALTADFQRADAAGGLETPTILTRGSKPRRGRINAEMDLVFAGLPPWLPGTESKGDDFSTPFGVYVLAEEICRRARHFSGTNALLVFYSEQGRGPTPDPHRQFRPLTQHALHHWKPLDHEGKDEAINVARLRKTFLEIRRRPVAQTPATLVGRYLTRDSATLVENQQVVADALDHEVTRVRVDSAVRLITQRDAQAAKTEPERIAAKYRLSVERLQEVLDGAQDTVAMACSAPHESPFSPSGQACTASFLLCLGCPCARSAPHHIPVQALLLRRIQKKKDDLDGVRWKARFADAANRLEDLLSSQHVNIDHEAAQVDGENRFLVEALVDGRLDLR